MSGPNDVFGCVDLIAKSWPDDKRESRTRWIQVTMDRAIGRKKSKLALIPWNIRHDSVEIWRLVDGSGKRLDGRTGKPRDRLYFQIYTLDDAFCLNKNRRCRIVDRP